MFDKKFGNVLGFVPALTGAKIFASVVLLSSTYSILHLIITAHIHQSQVKPTNDRYIPFDSCRGLQEASATTRYCIEVGFGLIFAFVGLVGLADSNWQKIYLFMLFLVGVIVERVGIFVWDLGYMATCGAYPENIIDQLVYWSVEDAPVVERKKQVLKAWPNYAYGRTNEYLQTNLILWYFILTIGLTLVLIYFAAIMHRIAHQLRYGPCGYGPHFDLGMALDEDVWEEGELGMSFSEHPLMKPVHINDNYSATANNDLFVRTGLDIEKELAKRAMRAADPQPASLGGVKRLDDPTMADDDGAGGMGGYMRDDRAFARARSGALADERNMQRLEKERTRVVAAWEKDDLEDVQGYRL